MFQKQSEICFLRKTAFEQEDKTMEIHHFTLVSDLMVHVLAYGRPLEALFPSGAR